ncbi:MAG: hypothetical protein R3C24_02055 [Cyanobacteriota/Melainabacteria group bacterium]
MRIIQVSGRNKRVTLRPMGSQPVKLSSRWYSSDIKPTKKAFGLVPDYSCDTADRGSIGNAQKHATLKSFSSFSLLEANSITPAAEVVPRAAVAVFETKALRKAVTSITSRRSY